MAEVIQLVTPDLSKKQVRMIFIAEGYTATQQEKFVRDSLVMFDAIRLQDFWNQYNDRWYASGVWEASVDEGTSFPEQGINKNTAWSSTLTGDRRLSLSNTGRTKVINVVYNELRLSPPIIVLVNDQVYGGTGGYRYLTMSMHPAAQEVARHEMGHHFGNLDDEYFMGEGTNSWIGANAQSINLDDTEDPLDAKWAPLIKAGRLGNPVRGEGTALWTRPKHECLMRQLNVPMCPVCSEQMLRVLRLECGISDPAVEPPKPLKPVLSIRKAYDKGVPMSYENHSACQLCFDQDTGQASIR